MRLFSETVKILRREKNLTLEAVAAKVGSHKGYISGIENRKVNPPSVKVVRKMAKLFGQNEAEMICLAEIEKSPAELQERYKFLEVLNRAVQSYMRLKAISSPKTDPPETGEKEREETLKEVWQIINETACRLNQQFNPPTNGNGKH